jgi:hypothetical protein
VRQSAEHDRTRPANPTGSAITADLGRGVVNNTAKLAGCWKITELPRIAADLHVM